MFFSPVLRSRARVAAPVFSAPAFAGVNRGLDRFFDDAFFGATATGLRMQEDEKAWTITVDMPGVTREDLSISAEGAVVRVETREEAPRRYRVAYELPQEIDVDATEAKLENGVLTLKLAKLVPVSRARQITLN